ncbi:glutaminase A [Methylocella sp.]|uniref:glutaminase A n=1 Tax=Methylocella sp. TaxID=1978226 RepID=UPI003783A332
MAKEPLQVILDALLAELRFVEGGEVASYIPALAAADPDSLAVAVATVDGKVYVAGDAAARFTIQSAAKPFAYGAALDRLGREAMLRKVGVEPTGEAFNAVVLDSVANRPFNAMVNAGAIAVSALFPGATREARAGAMLAALSRFAGRPLAIDEAAFRSEEETGHRNRAIAWLMLNSGMIEASPDDALDVYFRQSAALVDVRDLALMAATLANGGVNPLTRERALSQTHVGDVLTVMLTCGMYDYAGQWAYEVGLPAKSGVAGAIVAVAPGQFGLAAFAPPLDRFGNSVRGVAACRRLSELLSLHCLRQPPALARERVLRGGELRPGRRPRAGETQLDALANDVLVVAAQGDLCPAAAERLLRRAGEGLRDGARAVILDFARAPRVEPGALVLFEVFLRAPREPDRTLILAAPPPEFADRFDCASAPSLDAALEAAEELLLGARAPTAAELAPEDADLLAALPPAERKKLLEAALPVRRVFARGARVARAGEPTRELLLVSAGRLAVIARAGDGAPAPAGDLGPGSCVGALALFDETPAPADVVALGETTCWALPLAPLRAFLAPRPELSRAIAARLAVYLAGRLRRARAAARALGL